MMTLSIGEIQKNTAILSQLTQAISVVDKRKNIKVATIYPVHSVDRVSQLAGKYAHLVHPDALNPIDEALTLAWGEKHGLAH